jgi:asparagine synthase (glutamine-hydrolysing)
MPGIVGLITKMPREKAEAQLSRMVKALHHHSFYETGTWINESLGVYIGWTARDSSKSVAMPFQSERGDVSLVFSGEEYPDPATTQGLKGHGHSFDAEGFSYLVHLYEECPDFLKRLNGMFHGLLVDQRSGTATLFNDRIGMHRICYHEAKEAFYFAAEAKAILAARPALRTADPKGIGEFVACSCILENRTIFEGIYVLPAGSKWIFRDGSLGTKGSYFQPCEWEDQAPLAPQSYYSELREVLSRNLPRYFSGHEQIGIALTGGLDTRVIMACAKLPPNSLPCYTFGGMFRECEDVRIARSIARLCQQSHEVISVGEEFLTRFPQYAERSIYLTEGGVDVYRSSDLYVSKRAREIAPVKVVGTYGSEIICQAVMFKPVPPAEGLFHPEFLPHVLQAKDTYTALRRQHPVTFAAFRQSPWYHHGILALEQSQLQVRSPFLDHDFVRTTYRAPKEQGINGDDTRLRLIRDSNPALAQLRTDRGVGGNSGRLSSALTRAFLEFTFKAEYAYDYGMPQWLTRIDHAFSKLHFERLFLGRHKLLHFRVWYRDSLSEYVRQILLDPLTLSRPYLNRKGVEAVVQGHLKATGNYTTEIHKLLSIELLHRLLIDSR